MIAYSDSRVDQTSRLAIPGFPSSEIVLELQKSGETNCVVRFGLRVPMGAESGAVAEAP